MSSRFALFAALSALTVTIAAPARAAWIEAKSKHFIIYASESQGELKQFAQKLERFDRAVRLLRSMPDPDLTDAERLTIFVVPDQTAIEQLVGFQGVRGFYLTHNAASYAFVPQRSGVTMVQGDPGGTGTIRDTLTSEPVFFHEYAHHLQLQNSTVALPMWVTEGFAEFFATANVRNDGAVEIGRNPSYRSEALVWGGLPVEKMLSGDPNLYGDVLYAKGWLLTHYLSMTPARKGELNRYIDEIQKGQSPLDAAKTAFGDLKVLGRDLDQYGAQRSYLGFTIPASAIPVSPVSIRQLSPGESAMMRVVIRSKRGVDDYSSRNVATDAVRIASPFAADTHVQASLAEALYDDKQYAAANSAADRALAADPRNVNALIYKGRAELELAKANPKSANWDAIRHFFTEANKIDTENAEPMALFYRTYLEAGQQPTANAIDAMLYAAELAPQDQSITMTATRLLLALNRLSDARAMLAPIAYNPHADRETREKSVKVIAAIAQGDAKDAMSLMDNWNAKSAGSGK